MSSVEKDKPVKECRECWFVEQGVAVLYRMVRESHIDKMAFEKKPEASEGTSMQTAEGKISR